MRTAALLAALVAGGALAQTSDKPAAPEVGQPPVSDVGPAPAHERDSVGAVVMENSPVRAQRQVMMGAPPDGLVRVREVTNNSNRAQTQVDLARQREAEKMNLQLRGAGGQVVK
ncbi:hypothetical protein [Ramlibacter tataouinensis]|uniref:Uncharacterized protein n=1 Tax=Ramlibacter tataouinensis TaxID=94132 RepID=A0A127JYT7_9BURK|nr:hypothetical protein [Ramlibacter tataouinensis]AMO23272.1 hypothetical protein UC35_10655 [Ramlibacter tataouinensis]